MHEMSERSTSRSILVVDDNVDVRAILGVRLARAGFEVVTAGDALTGLAALNRCAPAGVVLDLLMPAMDGFEFLAILHRRHPSPPPVFVVSHSDDPDTRERAQQLGASELFTEGETLHRDFPACLGRLLRPVTATEEAEVPARPSCQTTS